MDRTRLQSEWKTQQALLSLQTHALDGEISLQAAKTLDIPSDQPFWLSQNWDAYIGGRPMMWDNEEHPQSDAIRQFLDSRPEQIAEIRQLHERLDNFPDFERWLEQNELDYRGDKAEASLEKADRMQEHAIAQKDIAMMRSNRAMQALGRSYG
ncbi:hypothetical protein [Marinobacterium arenosum]|uniref:hypothetical protein n=1 Tax=Marinobacterium arenosum TaxID=2862496 RepID=UPI001C979F77|nr:hypothetical protein [Marinobacterium arenosum]MBY4676222.1 hypothetical protein [Marinobacterium arenosum]